MPESNQGLLGHMRAQQKQLENSKTTQARIELKLARLKVRLSPKRGVPLIEVARQLSKVNATRRGQSNEGQWKRQQGATRAPTGNPSI